MSKRYNRPRGPQGGSMMAQIQQMQQQMEQAQADLAEETVEISVGGGVIQIVMSGGQVCKSIKISPELLEDADVEMIQDLITTGINSALEKSRELAAEKMSPFTNMLGGLGLGL